MIDFPCIYDIFASFELTDDFAMNEFDGFAFLEQTITKCDGNFKEAEKYMDFRDEIKKLKLEEVMYYVVEHREVYYYKCINFVLINTHRIHYCFLLASISTGVILV